MTTNTAQPANPDVDTARRLLTAFLANNLVARDPAALVRFVELVDHALGQGGLDASALSALRDAWWRRAAPTTDQFEAYYRGVFLPARVAEVREMVPARPATLLDIGFGDGRVLEALVEHWQLARLVVTGVETTGAAVRCDAGFTMAIVPSAEPWTIPRADRSFELVTAHNVLHHSGPPHAEHVLAEMARLVATGGRVLIREHDVTTAAEAHFLQQLEVLFDRVLAKVPAIGRHSAQYRSADQWVAALDDAGLDVVEIARPPVRAGHLQIDILARARR